MAVKIRLQRHGKKGKPFYWLVAVDSRVKRDGKFIEKLGTYNPVKNPAEITLKVDECVKWLRNGAQPSDTARRLLSYKGALLKHHLLKGVDKGAHSEEEVQKKFDVWLTEREQKLNQQSSDLEEKERKVLDKKLQTEKLYSEQRKKESEPKPVAIENNKESEKVTEKVDNPSTDEVATNQKN